MDSELMRLRHSAPLCCILVFIFVMGMIPSSRAYDRITTVQFPLMNRPALTVPGGTFTIRCAAASDVTGWSATLSMPYADVPLPVSVGGYSGGIRTLTAQVPAGTPFELYDLRVRASQDIDDRVVHAVRILPTFKQTFTMIHLPDCHLPAVAWELDYVDPNTVSELRQIIKEINIIAPEFVLQTGDIVNNGLNESEFQLAQEILEACEVPIFVTGGNHDLWYDAHANWNRYFGTSMNYSFRYGEVRFLGLEMYNEPPPAITYTSAQMEWLRNTLDSSIDAGESGRIIFTHFDESSQLTADFVDQYLVDGILYGHLHINLEQMWGIRQAPKLCTSYTMNDNGEYRLVKVQNGQIVDYPVLEFRHLRTHISPSNDGTSWKMRAQIFNDNDVDLEGILVKLHVDRRHAPFTITGGTELQHVDYDGFKRVYYVTSDAAAHGSTEINVTGVDPGNDPPMITTVSPYYDVNMYGGETVDFQIVVNDPDGPLPTTRWFLNGAEIPDQTGNSYSYQPLLSDEGVVTIAVEVSDGSLDDSHEWLVYVERSPGKPMLLTEDMRNFFPFDETVFIEWFEPVTDPNGFLEYGVSPGHYTGQIPESPGDANWVSFVPRDAGMAIGIYYCRIVSGGLSSDEFPIVVESSQAAQMISPIGNITSLSPVFTWQQVQEQGQGVPYYLLIMTDQEIIIQQDEETEEYSVEGANPLWAILVPAELTGEGILATEKTVAYGAPDPSGSFDFSPPPLIPGQDYWWIVLNCYGPYPELSSTVQSGVSRFHVDLPPPDLDPPELIAPAEDAALAGETILFRWTAVPNAVAYNFYPYKIEIEEGVEVVRPIWEATITTTNTALEYDAAANLVKGSYEWKVSSVAENGVEVMSQRRGLTYDAPFSTLHIRTFDSRGTPGSGDDVILPRVTVEYDAIVGVDMGLPLSTDNQGKRLNLLFAPGTYVFRANKEGFAPFEITRQLIEGAVVTANFRLSPDPSLITGRVQDGAGKPLSAARVVARHSLHPEITRSALTNQGGSFGVSLSPGPWRVSASKDGYSRSSEVSLSVESGETRAIETPLVLIKNTNTVQGSVVNPSGKTVYNALVTLWNDENIQKTKTNADGRFSFVTFDGSWLVQASKSGFTPSQTHVFYVTGGESYSVSPPLELEPSASLVIGSVSDGLRVVEGATVTAVPNSGTVVRSISDGYGQFQLTLSPGTYRISAEKEGYSPGDIVELSVGGGETVSGVVVLMSKNSGMIRGSATTDGITPLSQVRIDVDGKHAYTDNGGRYEVSIPTGTFRVTASKTGYLSSEPLDVTLTNGQIVDGVDFILTPNASVIRGRVVSNGGVAGASVHARDGVSVETMTDDDGYYSLNVSSGSYQVHAEKSGFLSEVLNVEVGQAQVIEGVNINLTRNSARIQGTITDGESGGGLMGVEVRVDLLGLSTTSKTDGSFGLDVIPSVSGYDVSATKEGYETKVQPTGALVPNDVVTLDFTLRMFSTLLSGLVIDEDGIPLSAVEILAVMDGESFRTVSRGDGSYRLSLPSAGGTFAVTAQKSGYRQAGGSIFIGFFPGEHKTQDFVLNSNFAGLAGRISNAVTDALVAAATVILSDATGIVSTTQSSSESGDYAFVDHTGAWILAEGAYTLTVTKAGYEDAVLQNVTLTGGSQTTEDIGLTPLTGLIEGQVTDGVLPVNGASIVAVHKATDRRYTQISASGGFFRLSSIPEGEFGLTVNKAGYTFGAELNVTSPVTGLVLVLSENVGRFWGVIRDSETGTGIGYASVVAKDGHGNEGRTHSASDGSYEIDLLPTMHPYDITVSRYGYSSASLSDVSSTQAAPTHFQLDRIWGSVAGRVSLPDSLGGAPVAGVTIRVQAGSTVYADTTDQQGIYQIVRLPTDYYYVFAEKAGHISVPSYRTLDLWGGGDVTDADFILQEVTLASLSITGPSTITSGGSGSYSYAGKTADGRQVSILPVWSVDNADAIQAFTQEGVLFPKDDTIGPLWVILTDNHSGMSDSIKIHVVKSLLPSDASFILKDHQGAEFHLPANCVAQPISIGLQFPDIPDIKRLLTRYRVEGRVYAFQPPYLTLSRPMTLVLPYGESGTSDVAGKWHRTRLTWESVEGVPADDGLHVETEELAQWAMLVASGPLGIREFDAKPNPFSPHLRPLRLSFVPTSRNSTAVIMTIKIYNMTGDLVRRLIVEESRPKDTVTEITWDGLTDAGTMALNGRYLVYIEVKDGADTETLLRPVVLIK